MRSRNRVRKKEGTIEKKEFEDREILIDKNIEEYHKDIKSGQKMFNGGLFVGLGGLAIKSSLYLDKIISNNTPYEILNNFSNVVANCNEFLATTVGFENIDNTTKLMITSGILLVGVSFNKMQQSEDKLLEETD